MCIVFFYAVLGGMKGITYTQVAQYCVLIFAYLVPAIFISILMTGNPIPQLGFGDTLVNSDTYLLDKLDKVTRELGFNAYTENTKTKIDESPRLFEWLPFTINQRDNLIKLSIKASWFGIGGLVILWIVVRFIGPAAGWWTLADSL